VARLIYKIDMTCIDSFWNPGSPTKRAHLFQAGLCTHFWDCSIINSKVTPRSQAKRQKADCRHRHTKETYRLDISISMENWESTFIVIVDEPRVAAVSAFWDRHELIRETWLIYVSNMAHLNETWLNHMHLNRFNSYASFTRETWLIHLIHITDSMHERDLRCERDTQKRPTDSCLSLHDMCCTPNRSKRDVCQSKVTERYDVCIPDIPHSHNRFNSYVACLIHTRGMTHSHLTGLTNDMTRLTCMLRAHVTWIHINV